MGGGAAGGSVVPAVAVQVVEFGLLTILIAVVAGSASWP